MAVQEGDTASLEHTFKNRAGRPAPARFVFPARLDLEPLEFEKSAAADDTEPSHWLRSLRHPPAWNKPVTHRTPGWRDDHVLTWTTLVLYL